MQAKLYSEVETFFGQDTRTKRKYEIASLAGQRGYTSFGREHAKVFQPGFERILAGWTTRACV